MTNKSTFWKLNLWRCMSYFCLQLTTATSGIFSIIFVIRGTSGVEQLRNTSIHLKREIKNTILIDALYYKFAKSEQALQRNWLTFVGVWPLCPSCPLCPLCPHVAWGFPFCTGRSWVASSNPSVATSRFFLFRFFASWCFYPLACLCLFALLTLFSSARFLG